MEDSETDTIEPIQETTIEYVSRDEFNRVIAELNATIGMLQSQIDILETLEETNDDRTEPNITTGNDAGTEYSGSDSGTDETAQETTNESGNAKRPFRRHPYFRKIRFW